MKPYFDFLGFMAGALTTLAFIPQAYKVFKTKKTADISLGMFALSTAGVFLWMLYGVFNAALPIIIANAITLFLSFYIMMMKIRYK